MLRTVLNIALLIGLLASPFATARPYPGISGIAATADSAQTAGNNPAGSARFKERAVDGEIMWFASDSEWETRSSEAGQKSSTFESDDTIVPRVSYIEPINEDFTFSFTFLGAGFSDDFGDWGGRYFIKSYDSVMVSAYPSIAYRIDDKWSIAGSLALTYSSFEQERDVANIFDPGFDDGTSTVETDSFEVGFGLSTLYQSSESTRWGLSYQSEIKSEQEGDNDLSGLGPNTQATLERLGIVEADITIESTTPQSLVAGMYHEFSNDHAVTVDLAWIDFSRFVLSEYYFNGEGFVQTDSEYDDIYALAASYTWPVSNRWMLGVGGFATTEMMDDEDRSPTFRVDAAWSLGLAAEWQWTDSRAVKMSVSYIGVGEAPVSTAEIPGFGSFEGEYKSRDTILFQIGMSLGAL